jgi:hypothetical protein
MLPVRLTGADAADTPTGFDIEPVDTLADFDVRRELFLATVSRSTPVSRIPYGRWRHI